MRAHLRGAGNESPKELAGAQDAIRAPKRVHAAAARRAASQFENAHGQPSSRAWRVACYFCSEIAPRATLHE